MKIKNITKIFSFYLPWWDWRRGQMLLSLFINILHVLAFLLTEIIEHSFCIFILLVLTDEESVDLFSLT
jgi:hypothetical protein